MRGKVVAVAAAVAVAGITPAYAGKSLVVFWPQGASKDHPRVCGEKMSVPMLVYRLLGSPPRMRGKAIRAGQCRPPARITPAYAGKSNAAQTGYAHSWDHPRVCGEKKRGSWLLSMVWGSPPRMRGKGVRLMILMVEMVDHPRVCGEKTKKIP